MKNALAAFAVGLIFAVGLGISGMTQPQKVVGFLDLFGQWDPSLAFVMMGSIGVHFFSYRWIRRRTSPLFSLDWHVPTRPDLTFSLMMGSAIFGLGWGLGGYCPGPAITSVASFHPAPLVFVGGMLLGMVLFRQLNKRLKFKL